MWTSCKLRQSFFLLCEGEINDLPLVQAVQAPPRMGQLGKRLPRASDVTQMVQPIVRDVLRQQPHAQAAGANGSVHAAPIRMRVDVEWTHQNTVREMLICTILYFIYFLLFIVLFDRVGRCATCNSCIVVRGI